MTSFSRKAMLVLGTMLMVMLATAAGAEPASAAAAKSAGDRPLAIILRNFQAVADGCHSPESAFTTEWNLFPNSHHHIIIIHSHA
jgi:hypothetical protein